jgi:hypothetical protein
VVEKKNFRKRNDRSMIRRCQADSVHRAAGQRRSEIFRKKVENFSKYFPSALEDSSFTIYREGHGTSEMEKISKFFHRLLRFDSPALRLTKTS